MVRENRIKNFSFSEAISATSTETFTGSYPINGEVLEVSYSYGSQGAAGSMFLTESGTGRELWKDLVASGAGVQYAYPRVYSQFTTGSQSVANGARLIPQLVNAPLILNTGSVLSGTTAVTVDIKYR